MLIVPILDALKNGDHPVQHFPGGGLVGLGFFVDKQLCAVLRQLVEEVQLFRDIGEDLGPLLQKGGDGGGVILLVLHRLTDVGLRHLGKFLRGHGPDVFAVEVFQLFNVEDGGRLGDAAHLENFLQLVHGEDLLLAPGAPAQKRHIVDHRVGEIALGDQILVGGVAVALGHLVVGVPHNGRAVDIAGNIPTEALVQQVVLGGGGQVLAASDHMGDAHQVVVHHIGKVIGGQAVPLDQHLVVQGGIFHGDITEDLVVEGGGSLMGDTLADNVRLTGSGPAVRLFPAHIPAGVIAPVEFAGVLLRLALLAEAAVGVALFHQQLRVLLVQGAALGLHIGAHRAAHVRAFVMLQVALSHGLVDHIHSAFHQTALIRVLNTEDELAVVVSCNKIGIESGPQIAHMHIAGGRGRKTGAHLVFGDACLHIRKPFHVFHRYRPPKSHGYFDLLYLILHFPCCQDELNLIEYEDANFCQFPSFREVQIWTVKRKPCSPAFSPPATCTWAIIWAR